jgi:replicative DNA helicase
MTVAEQLFVACLSKKDGKNFSKIQRKWLDGEELLQHNFVHDYYKDYGELVGVKTFCEKFKLPESVDARPTYYLNKVKERFIFATLSDKIPKLVRGIEKDPRGKLSELQEVVSELMVDSVESKDVLYSDDIDLRKSEYEDRMKSRGVTYLSMGSEVMDSTFYGYRKQDLITIGGRAGQGKCLGKGTKVLMYDLTTKNVEDVVVGDRLMGPDGNVRNVLNVATGTEQMYWVRQVRGEDYRVNESHILSLRVPKTKAHRATINGKRVYQSCETTWSTENLSVREYLTRPKSFKKAAKGYKSFGMEFPDSTLEIDPYFLGIWLGDGHSRELCITNIDSEILDYCAKYAESFGGSFENCPSSPIIYRMKGCGRLREIMDSLKLIKGRYKKHTGRKHIPMEYIKTSRENRLQLLAGLIDSDGYLGQNSFEVTFKLKELHENLVLLCRTLGLAVSTSIKLVNGVLYYKANIYGNTDEIPTRIPRKKASERKQIKNANHTGVTVEKDVVDTYYGFTIDGDHLFCLADFTVTHNTWYLVYLAFLLDKVLKERELMGDTFGEILFISNEMGEEEIKERIDCLTFKLPYERFLSGKLTEREKLRYYKGLDSLKENRSKIRILESCQTIEDLTTHIGMYKPSVVFIDGSYLMEPKMAEGWEKIVYVTRNLKRVAKAFKVPIINTTQLKRGAGKGGSKTAADSQDDFAYSNSYVQDSDIAMRMFQDPDMKFHDLVGMEVAKGRRVKAGTVLMFQNDLENVCHSITLPTEHEEPERKTDY